MTEIVRTPDGYFAVSERVTGQLLDGWAPDGTAAATSRPHAPLAVGQELVTGL